VDAMKTTKNKSSNQSAPNKLCTSCRRTCKQASNAVVAKCPRYYPFKNSMGKQPAEFTWKQMELIL
jgi:hypothetical protein